MKKVISIVILLMVAIANSLQAQDVSEVQKQKALDMATQFCTLLSQFSDGKSEYLANDRLIFDLCSSSKISTYDDIVENKEDILATYLINITHDYYNDLPMTFSKPVVESVFGLPDVDFIYEGYLPQMKISGYTDIYIIMSCTQTISLLNKSTARKIIYSCNENKIISFCNSDSPFISLQKGLIAFSRKDYESTLVYLDKVIAARRFDYKEACYTLATICCQLMNDMERSIAYSSKTKSQGFANVIKGYALLERNDYAGAIKCFEQSALLEYEASYCSLAVLYCMDDTGCQNFSLAKKYFIKAINSKDKYVKATGAYWYAIAALLSESQEIALETNKTIEYLEISAQNWYVMAYLPLAVLYEKVGKTVDAATWELIAIEDCTSHVAMAMLGKCYLSSPKAETVKEGLELLQKSIEQNLLDRELDSLWEQTGLEPIFPKSSDDVKQLLQKYNK